MTPQRETGRLTAIILVAGTAVCLSQTPGQPEVRRVRANGVDLAYVEQGAGTPVVFAHGAVGDLRFWEPQRQDISRAHRFIAYTYRYHGTDPWPDQAAAYSAATHAADLAAFVRALEAGPVHLVGLSYGGTLVTMVAQQHPELVRSLTLAEAPFFALMADVPEGKAVLEEVGKTFGAITELAKAGDALGATKRLIDWVDNKGTGSFDRQPESLRTMLQDNARTLPLLLAGPPEPPVTCASLGSVKVPTLVVGGQQTARAFSLTNERLVACIPASRLAIVPDSTHVMTYQNPAAFNKELLAFLAAADSAK